MGHVFSSVEVGFSGHTVEVECHISNNLPAIVIVGLASKAVDEAKERIRAAMTNSGVAFPKKRIVLNLAPADLPKDSACMDLAMCAAIMNSAGLILPVKSKSLYVGELGLDGSLKPAKGLIGKLLVAKKKGFKEIFLPAANMAQAQLIEGLSVFPLENLSQYFQHASGTLKLEPIETTGLLDNLSGSSQEPEIDMSEVVGQNLAKRACLIAAAGRHNVLLSGPPGVGKSMLSKATAGILPRLNAEEALEATHIHSLVGNSAEAVIINPPFRSPHHSSSDIALLGGGQKPRPGEVSLAHKGILFMDELPEFSRVSIEGLRQPLEDRKINVARAKESVVYPADILLIATRNPCPCGFLNSSKPCVCTPQQILKYDQKLSGPILDRLDIHVIVDNISNDRLLDSSSGEKTSKDFKNQVMRARSAQAKRYGNNNLHNGQLSSKQIKDLIKLDPAARQLIEKSSASLGLSARAFMKTIKVAQTIADLDSSPSVGVEHVSEALQYRQRTVL